MHTVSSGDLTWVKDMPVAHRGLHSNDGQIPENSLKAFDNAVRHNYAIELDVHVIADKEVVVFHDDNLLRMCGVNKPVASLTTHNFGSYSLLGSAERIPSLQEVLTLVEGKVPLLIEVKIQRVKNANLIILNALLGYKGPVAIQSFNPFTVGWFAKNAPSIIRGHLSSAFKDDKINVILKFLLKKLTFNFRSKPHFIAYDVRDLPDTRIEKERLKGKIILGWTVRSEASYAEITPYCDNIIFEGFSPGRKAVEE